MQATRHPANDPAPPDEPLDGQPPPIPDEDGPHDVEDEKVIEKTLPAAPAPGRGDGGAPRGESHP